MRIEENKVFLFTFDTGEMGNLSIPVRGEDRADAANKLQTIFGRMQTELALEFPKVAPQASVAAQGVGSMEHPMAGIIPSEVLEMRIDTLLGDLGATGLTDSAKAQTIKNWTELEFVPDNYAAIITKLERLASGAEEVPAPKGKKK